MAEKDDLPAGEHKVTDLKWPAAFTPEVLNLFLAPFPLDEIEFRVIGKANAKGTAKAFAYIDARAVMRRLDEVVGPANWSFDWEPMTQNGDKVKGKLTIFGVTKCDAGEHEGGDGSKAEPMKSAVSDSLKRCAIMFGIGRFLYYLGDIWAPHNGKWFTTEPVILPKHLTNACRIIGYVGEAKFPPRTVRRSFDDEYTPAAAAPVQNAPRTQREPQGGPPPPEPPQETAPAVDEAPPLPVEEAPPPTTAKPPAAPAASDGKLSQEQLRKVVALVNDSGMGKEVRAAMQEKLNLKKFNPTDLPAVIAGADVVDFVAQVVAGVRAAKSNGA